MYKIDTMAKRFTRLMAALALLIFMAPSMVTWGQTRSEVVAYTLDGTQTGGSSGYDTESDITQNNISWKVKGNTTMNPWRIGGKSISGVDRPVYSTTPIADNITKIEVEHGTASGITVNSWTVIVASDASFTNVVSTLTPTFTANATTTINRPTGADWTDCYYKFIYNVTVSQSSNKFVQFVKADFYKQEGSGPVIATPTFDPVGGSYTTTQNVTISCETLGASIYYTTNGDTPTNANTLYNGAITVSETTTINAIAYVGNDASSVASATYTIVNLGHAGTLEDPYTVADARAAIDANVGVIGVYATGIVSEIVTAYNSTYGNITFDIIDEVGNSATLRAYRCGGTEAANVAVNDIVVVYGDLTKYGSTYEFGQDCQLVSLTHPSVPSITVTPATLNVDAQQHLVNYLDLVYENIDVEDGSSFTVHYYNAEGEEIQLVPGEAWMVAGVAKPNDVYQVLCTIIANEGEARTAYFKVSALDAENNTVYSNLVTVNQEAYVAPTYAELPFAFNGGKADIEGTDGLYEEGLGTDYNATNNPTTKLKFDGTGDWLLLQFDERPGTLTFDIKNNSFSGGTFKVQTSEDGVTYTDLETYTEISGTQNEEFTNLGENVRYIKWIYTNKSSGNVGLGNITLAEYVEPVIVASITVTPDVVNVNAAEHDGTLTLAYENLTITEMSDFDIQYYNAEGQEAETPDWIEVLVAEQDPQIGEGYVVSYYMLENEGEARTAYFKVYAMDDETNLVHSNLVTINQEAYVAPVPSITITPDVVNLDAGQQLVNLLDLAYENIEVEGPGSFTVHYYNAQGDEIELVQGEAWLVAGVVLQDSVYQVLFTVVANYGEARTVYLRVSCGETYSNLVTITQAAPVLDYAFLPFEWGGGERSAFEALNGTSTHGVGDYAATQGVYRMKLDSDGDYIMVRTDGQPGVVTIGVKMVGGSDTSTITIQGSADGDTFTDIEELTISGTQNDTLTLETTNAFADADRYVRMLFTKGSNVGVGPITIAKGTAPSINVAPATFDLEAVGDLNGMHVVTSFVTYYNIDITQASDFHIQFYNAEGVEQEKPEWILGATVSLVANSYQAACMVAANDSVARSAYYKVYAFDADSIPVYSNCVTINQAGVVSQYTLTVEPFENLDLITFVNDEMVMEDDGEIQVNEGDEIMLSVVALEGYEMETLMVNGVDHVNDIAADFTYSFEMPAENVTISATAVEYVPPTGDEYALYTGGLVEGDYLIVYDGGAMNTTVESDRLQFEVVTATNNVIVTDNAAIVWHIAKSGEYWTIYNADADAYAASTGVKNKAQMLADGTDDKALWTVSGTETYEFVNKHNAVNSVNANLRKNGTYGFACYATSTGGALSLYKKVTPVTQTLSLSEGENWVSFNVKTTLDDLKEALLNALGDDVTNIKITSQSNGYTYWDGDSWRGSLNPFEINQMYVIEVPGNCEISLSAMPVNPARSITIVNGTNWIGFPFSANMSLSNAFSGFAENGDKILAPNGSFATYNGDNWEGGLTELRPGQGYKYEVTTAGVRILVFPSSK